MRSRIRCFLILLQVQLILGQWSFSFIKSSKRKQHTLSRMEQNLLLFFIAWVGCSGPSNMFVFFYVGARKDLKYKFVQEQNILLFYIVWVRCGGPSNMFVLCYNGARTDLKYKFVQGGAIIVGFLWWIFVTTYNFNLLLNII